jgi:uncharacterized membrane protein
VPVTACRKGVRVLDHRTVSEDRPSPPAPGVLLAVGVSIVVMTILAAALVLATGGSALTLLVGALTGATFGVIGGRAALRMLRAKTVQR